MSPKYDQLKQDILFEQAQIDKVILKIGELKTNITDPNVAAIAAYLMNFYNGVENIMKRCATQYYKKMPHGGDWHKQLLTQSCLPHKNKLPLFEEAVVDKLRDYLVFRHFFIHGYGFQLDWDKMLPLVDGLDGLWKEVKGCINEFISKI